MKLTQFERDNLDRAVLAAAAQWNPGSATYVLRNRVSRLKTWSGITTPDVLRSCRRLEKAGLLQPYRESSYLVMLAWELTDAGRSALSEAEEGRQNG